MNLPLTREVSAAKPQTEGEKNISDAAVAELDLET